MRQKGIDSIALALGLSKDHARNGAYGQVNGYYLCVQQLSAVNQYLVRLPAEGSAEGADRLREFLSKYMEHSPALLWAETVPHGVEARFMCMSPVLDSSGIHDFLNALTTLLHEINFTACCMDCGAPFPLSVCGIDGGYRVLCPDCFASQHMQRSAVQEDGQRRRSRLPGTLLGALPGLAVLTVLLCFGVFSAPAGVLVGVFAALGCQRGKRGPLGRTDIWLTAGLCAVLMLLCFWFGLSAQVYRTFSPYYYIGFWDVFTDIPGSMAGELLWMNGLVALLIGLVLMFVSVVLTAKSAARRVRTVKEAVRLTA